MPSLCNVCIQPRRRRERGGALVRNDSSVALLVSISVGVRELELRELDPGGCWLIQRSLRMGQWVFFTGSCSTVQRGPLRLRARSTSDRSEETWLLHANGEIRRLDDTTTELSTEASSDPADSNAHDTIRKEASAGVTVGESEIGHGSEDEEGGPGDGDESGEESEQDGDEAVSIDVVCHDVSGAVLRACTLSGVPVMTSLADLRRRCAEELGVHDVDAQDYNEDMNDLSLLELGIGRTGLPFSIIEAPGDSADPQLVAASLTDVAKGTSPSVAGAHVSDTIVAANVTGEGSVGTADNRQRSGSTRASRQGSDARLVRRGSPARRGDIGCATSSSKPAASQVASSGGRSGATTAGKRPLIERHALEDCKDVHDGWLFLGGSIAASNLVVLQELGVTHVLNCCERVPCKFKKALNYKVLAVPDLKHVDIRGHFEEVLGFIDVAHDSGGGVLVHCMVGASRSTTIVLAWLISRCRIPLADAFREVRARRSVARPNRGFSLQLMDYEEEILGARTATLATFGHS
eukprot:TRINITY_DN49891_c0_g1_i1.p1 TRINITY_DN49891_c0_g1~~TRINITY_DN49891_c0_g1_i1.p1  ORF type:complete len:542 (-),score=81.69 TRINITY_DN49891_c0_g1_i1:65-1627(-)